MLTADSQKVGGQGRNSVSTQPFFQTARMKTDAFTAKLRAKTPKTAAMNPLTQGFAPRRTTPNGPVKAVMPSPRPQNRKMIPNANVAACAIADLIRRIVYKRVEELIKGFIGP